MTIRHFRIYKTVCDCGGISAAAVQLNISQPTVSIAIQELEVYYHTKLFDRINRTIFLTQQGKLLRQYVENMLTEYDEAAAVLRDDSLFTTCRLGVNTSFAETHLASKVRQIKEAVPDIDLHIVVQNNQQLEHMLSENRIDFAVYDGTDTRSSKHVHPLYKEQLAAVCTSELYAAASIDMKTLSTYSLLLREKGSGMRTVVDQAFFAHNLPQCSCIESVSTMSLLAAAEQGMGILFLPQPLAEKMCGNGQLHIVHITDEELFRSYYLAYNEHKYFTEAIKEVRKVLLQKEVLGVESVSTCG